MDLDGDEVVFTTWHESVKVANIRHDPRVGLCADEKTPPFAFALIEGTTKIETDALDLLYWATQIAGRYMGVERAEEYGRRNAVPGELLVRVTPTKVVAKKNISG